MIRFSRLNLGSSTYSVSLEKELVRSLDFSSKDCDVLDSSSFTSPSWLEGSWP